MLVGGNKAKCRITTMDLRREDFVRDLLGSIPWHIVLERGRVRES